MTEDFLFANGLRFHYLADGPSDGPLVLLLHGFPEYSYSWRHQIPALAERGLRVVAPDLRGYNLSDKPRGVHCYDMDRLADDVVGMIAALGHERAYLVGHDWGGGVAWHVASSHPERIARLGVLACPPPAEMARTLLRSGRQLLRSWYMFFFQLPLLPEFLLSGSRLAHALRRWDRGSSFSEADLSRFIEAADRPRALQSAVHYYRAAFRRLPELLRAPPPPRVQAKTLVIWGGRDPVLGRELTVHLDRWVAGPLRVEVLEGVSHFVQQEAPQEVNRLLVEFLGQ